MDELISREKAIDTVHSMRKRCDTNDIDDYHDLMVESLKMLPSAERHGRWIYEDFYLPHGTGWVHCSECGKRDVYSQATMPNYCPDCGATMDGEQDVHSK